MFLVRCLKLGLWLIRAEEIDIKYAVANKHTFMLKNPKSGSFVKIILLKKSVKVSLFSAIIHNPMENRCFFVSGNANFLVGRPCSAL